MRAPLGEVEAEAHDAVAGMGIQVADAPQWEGVGSREESAGEFVGAVSGGGGGPSAHNFSLLRWTVDGGGALVRFRAQA